MPSRWADALVRVWRTRDYQKPLLDRAGLIEAARRREWKRLPEMLRWLEQDGRDPVFAASLIRLLRHCDDDAKKGVLLRALGDPSPLVRASAAEALGDDLDVAALRPLVRATGDDYRLVRIRTASSLAGVPPRLLDAPSRAAVSRAIGEFASALGSRPDDALAHYNLGNLHFRRGAAERAIDAFETAIRLRPRLIEPRVNLALAYSAAGRPVDAESSLREALRIDPASAAVNFNLGLLLGEMGRIDEARDALRRALQSDPDLAPAAYNLAIMSAGDDIGEAIRYCRLTAGRRPEEPKHAYTLAFYLRQGGDTEGAVAELRDLIRRHPDFRDAQGLLRAIEMESGP